MTFTIGIVQQSMQITLMLQQETAFSIEDSATISADNFNVTTDTFTIGITQQSVRIA